MDRIGRANRVRDTAGDPPLAPGWWILAALEATLGTVLTIMGMLPLVMAIGTALSPGSDPYALALFGLGALVFFPLGAMLLLAAFALWKRWRHWRMLQLLPLVVVVVLMALT